MIGTSARTITLKQTPISIPASAPQTLLATAYGAAGHPSISPSQARRLIGEEDQRITRLDYATNLKTMNRLGNTTNMTWLPAQVEYLLVVFTTDSEAGAQDTLIVHQHF
jgi:hypothetical protein